MLQASQPGLTFRPVNQGEIKIDGQTGAYGAFGALDKNEQLVSVGAIGAWSCGANSPTYAMTVAGTNQQATEASFQGFTNGFKCPA